MADNGGSWGSSELLGLLAMAAIAVTVATVLPVWWVWRVVVAVAGTLLLFFVVSLFSPSLARLARFLSGAARPGPPLSGGDLRLGGSLKATVIRAGASADDPEAARVVAEYLDGTANIEEVLPPDADVKAALASVVKRLNVPVKSVRALQGSKEVARWRPNLWRRVQMAWWRA